MLGEKLQLYQARQYLQANFTSSSTKKRPERSPTISRTSLARCFLKSILSIIGCFYLEFKNKILVKKKKHRTFTIYRTSIWMSSLVAKCCVGNNYGETKSLGNAVNTDLKYSTSKHWQSLLSQPVLFAGLVKEKKKTLYYSLLLSHCSELTQFWCCANNTDLCEQGTSGGVSFSGKTWWCPMVRCTASLLLLQCRDP